MEQKYSNENRADTLLEKAENVDKDGRYGKLSEKSKRLRTFLIYVTYLLHGMQNNLLGPSLIDLEYLTGSTTAAISTLFTWRNGGYLLGALAGGSIIDRVNENLMMSGALFLMCITVTIAPFCRTLLGLSVTYGVIGLSASVNTVGAATTVLMMWSTRSDPYQMALHFVVNAGAALSPQIFKPFLMTSHSPNATDQTRVKVEYGNETESSGNQYDSSGYSQVHFGYLIIAVGLLIMSVCHLSVFIYDGSQIKRVFKKTDRDSNKTVNIDGKSKIIVLFMFVILASIQGGIEELFGGFLMTFSVKHLKWSKIKGSDIATIFWASTSCSRGVGIIASKFLKASTILAFDVALLVVSGAVFVYALNLHWIIPWLCTVLTGVGVGTAMASLINWGNSCTTLRGKETSLMFAGASVTRMTTIALVGYLFQAVSPMWFAYINVIYSLSFLLIFIISIIVVVIMTKRLEHLIRKSDENRNTLKLELHCE